MDNENKAGLIVCSPEMYEYLKDESKGSMPPRQSFIITELVHPDMAYVVVRDDFLDWLDAHGTAWAK